MGNYTVRLGGLLLGTCLVAGFANSSTPISYQGNFTYSMTNVNASSTGSGVIIETTGKGRPANQASPLYNRRTRTPIPRSVQLGIVKRSLSAIPRFHPAVWAGMAVIGYIWDDTQGQWGEFVEESSSDIFEDLQFNDPYQWHYITWDNDFPQNIANPGPDKTIQQHAQDVTTYWLQFTNRDLWGLGPTGVTPDGLQWVTFCMASSEDHLNTCLTTTGGSSTQWARQRLGAFTDTGATGFPDEISTTEEFQPINIDSLSESDLDSLLDDPNIIQDAITTGINQDLGSLIADGPYNLPDIVISDSNQAATDAFHQWLNETGQTTEDAPLTEGNPDVETPPEATDVIPDIPEVEELEWHEIDIVPDDFNEWADPFGSSAQCPPGHEFTVFGTTYEYSWEPMCDVAEGVRPFLLVIGYLMAGYMLVRR